jgi:hypothetical protein
MSEPSWDESAWARARREFEPAYLGLRGVVWSLLCGAAAIVAQIYLSPGHGPAAQALISVGCFLGGVVIGAITTFAALVLRAPYRQRDEARAEIDELTAPREFPNVYIQSHNFLEVWEDHAGNRGYKHGTARPRSRMVVTNREESRSVSLTFRVSAYNPDGELEANYLPTEQHAEAPLVVAPQDSEAFELSFFLNEYVIGRIQKIERGVPVIDAEQFRLNVFDLLSQKGIEMEMIGTYPPARRLEPENE